MGGGVRPVFSISGMGASIGEAMFMVLCIWAWGRGVVENEDRGAGLVEGGEGDL
jgi:hypothetical protein